MPAKKYIVSLSKDRYRSRSLFNRDGLLGSSPRLSPLDVTIIRRTNGRFRAGRKSLSHESVSETLRQEVEAWEQRRNQTSSPVDWQFTTEDARIKLKRLYPSF